MTVRFEDEPRVGDHRWWISDCSKFRTDYPSWKVTRSLREIVAEIAAAYSSKAAA
jgi:CDP-paratose 2-epimerase